MQYFYDKQLRKYINQFIRLFNGFSVEMGVNGDGTRVYQTVPARYGDVSRMAAHIIKNNSENVINSAPFISCYITDLSITPERRVTPTHRETAQVYEKKYNEATGEYTEEVGNTYQVERHAPVPYDMVMNVDVWTSNSEQKLQLLEQILVLFNPSVNIRTNQNAYDWSNLTTVELINTTWSLRSIPSGVDDTIDVSTLQFRVPIFINPPARVQRQNVIHTILNNINGVDDAELLSFKQGEDFSSQFQGFSIVTFGNYKLQYLDNKAKILNKNGGSTDDDGNPLVWDSVLNQYGQIHEGVSQLRLRRGGDPTDPSNDVIGTISIDLNDPSLLDVVIDQDTLPANTQGTIDAIIDPTVSYPGDGDLPVATSGQRYLILGDVPVTGLWGVTAFQNDIIAYNGSAWTVVFDASANSNTEFVTNTTSGDQFEWNGAVWQNSYEGTYRAGYFRLYL